MATLSLVPRVAITITVRDGDGNKRKCEIYRAAALTATIADLQTEAQTALSLVDELTAGLIVDCSVRIDGSVTGEDAATEGTQFSSDVERKGSFVYRLGNDSTTRVEIPAIKADALVPGRNIIDPTAAAVVAFNNYMTGNGTEPSLSGYGVAIAELLSMKKIHRASDKG